MSEKNEATETKEIRFDFTVEGMEVDQTQHLMDLIREWLAIWATALEMGGGFYPYKGELDPRDAVIDALREFRGIGWVVPHFDACDFVMNGEKCNCGQAEVETALDALEVNDVQNNRNK